MDSSALTPALALGKDVLHVGGGGRRVQGRAGQEAILERVPLLAELRVSTGVLGQEGGS